MGGTSQAKERRLREGFFRKYCQGEGVDIGGGHDPLHLENCAVYDKQQKFSDMTPEELSMGQWDYVYSSHCLEHVEDPKETFLNWWDLVKYGGYLILYLPHMDIYEKSEELPSKWNPSHKWYFSLRYGFFKKHVIPVFKLLKVIPDCECDLIYIKKCADGHTIDDPTKPSDPEFSIEIVIRKIKHPGWKNYNAK